MSLSAEGLRREAGKAGFRIGELDRESMLAERPALEQAIEAVAGRLGLVPQRTPDAHAGGKLAALISRGAGRDLFDAHQLLTACDLDTNRLRLAFVLYGAMNRRDWRSVSVDDVRGDPRELRNQLLPTLRTGFVDHLRSPEQWAKHLVDECRDAMAKVLPLEATELEFLDRLLNRGEIRPQLLDVDAQLAGMIEQHPALLWKAWHARNREK